MDLGLTGKVVIVTGGSKGIGLACARAFAAEGARVAIASRSADNLARARERLGQEGASVLAQPADLARPEDAAALVAAVERELGPVDVLVNCAGAAKRHLVEELDSAAWQQGITAKYYPYVHAMDAVRAGMIARRRGAIVNVVGMGGKLGQPQHLAGGAANAALMLVTVGMANALGPYGIRVNAINPGLTFTERLQQALRLQAQSEGVTEAELLARNQSHLPLGRYGKPEEIAAVAVFLASDRASYVTGAIVPMDGGRTPVI
jgi:NAD(P)-dependent dehydrogenase (short-subunit alcohol dehydrogenase family)